MATNVVLPFDGDMDRLRRVLASWGFEIGERPNTPVFAQSLGITVQAYRTGKLVVSGARAETFAAQAGPDLTGASLRPAASASASPSGSGHAPASPPAPASGPPKRSEPGWTLHFDGSCMPRNPGGIAAYGFVARKDGALVHEGHGVAAPPGPGATNNVAEFTGLLEALRWLRPRWRQGEPVRVRGDSDLVIASLTGRRSLHKEHLIALRDQARALVDALGARLEWVPREENADADRMSRVGFAEAARAHPEWVR
ncbi:MAG TPA: reverse transcriptase-like protein [Candidatus Thermoplasmatota archaeon]|nr:reverse transcriptase-like protein [Candidatus Thermoplasmatota archaeon]